MTLIGHRDPAIRAIGEPDDEESVHAPAGRMKLLRRDTRNDARGANDEEERREGERRFRRRERVESVSQSGVKEGGKRKEEGREQSVRLAMPHDTRGGVTRNLRSLRKVAARRLIRAARLLKGRTACVLSSFPSSFLSLPSFIRKEG